MFFLWTGSEYRNIDFDNVEWIRPALRGTQCDIFVKYKNAKEEVFTGAQASSVLEFVLRRLVSSPNGAMETIFQNAEQEKDLTKHNGNGHKPRRKRVLRDPEASRRRMSESALRRWSRERQQREALEAAPTA
jgi:hypothetical protein